MVNLGNFYRCKHSRTFLWRHGDARSAYKESHNGNRTITVQGSTTGEETGNKHVRTAQT
jgi:phosphohistidine phosphatase SixA